MALFLSFYDLYNMNVKIFKLFRFEKLKFLHFFIVAIWALLPYDETNSYDR